MVRQAGFFDIDNRLKRLSDLGDQLEAYAAGVDFEMFRADLDNSLAYSDGKKGGRPPFDAVLMFKILIIKAQNNLSDDRAEFLISDRLSFMRFLGLGLQDKVPDAKTIWAFRERLTKAKAIDGLFARFDVALREAGYIAMSGQLIDSTLVAAPKQRNTDEEKQAVKESKTAAEIWPDDPAKARQKDVDARWTVQFGKAKTPKDGGPAPPDIAIPSFGYKNHASIDKAFRFIRRWDVTDAARHDGRRLRRGLLDTSNTGSGVWADSAYRSKANEAFMARRGFVSHVHHRKPAGRPMPKHIKRGNSTKSKHRAPIEHVFAVQKHMMGLAVPTIGVARARTKIGVANIAYNIRRLVQIGGAITA
ncbi:MAG: IS5 family transposase [Pseudomonadota bacterium]